jgi:hypothetical protein
MRIGVISAALCLAAIPAFAQAPREVTGPWTLTPNMVLCTDLPVTALPPFRSVIKGVHSADPRLAAGHRGVPLVIARTADDGLIPGQRYVTARPNGDRKMPTEDGAFGDLRITGVVTIKATDEVNAMAEIDFACDAIEPGDFLEPHVELSLPNAAASSEVAPDFTDRAKILFGSDSRSLVGMGSIISVDRGTLHGVIPGARFAVYRDKRNGMPLIYLGEAVVLVTGELSSKVMITKAIDGIETNDVAVPRRTQ